MSYGKIRVVRIINATSPVQIMRWEDEEFKAEKYEFPYTKYNIKETDFRTKTASFTSPRYIDLTTGQYAILIESDYHENFAGIILDAEYDEDTGLYTYQCQDWSRRYVRKFEWVTDGEVYTMLRMLITNFALPFKPSQAQLDGVKTAISGLHPIEMYDQSLYAGNLYNGNPMKQSIKVAIRDKTIIETIRDIVFSRLGYFDVYFDDKGFIHIDPISRTDWENTGLILSDNEFYNRKFKFSTTNAITAVTVNGSGVNYGSSFTAADLTGLPLNAFFGTVGTTISNPNDTSNAVTTTSSTGGKTTTKNTTTTTPTNKYGNPYNNKKKNIIVSADGGSSDYRSAIIKLLKKDGWNVKDLGTGPGTHSKSYNILSSKYSVNLTIYNGVDPKTIDEPVTGWLKGRHEKYGVALVQMFDSRHWTSTVGKYNAHGQRPFRYGDFDGYRVPKAWDDNYSGARNGVLINDLGAWYKKYFPKAIHCCHPTTSGAFKQFKAGGYLRLKGIKK